MKTNWREVRKSLADDEAFSTFSTINRRDADQANTVSEEESKVVKSVNSVESLKTANPSSQNPKAKRAKSAESPENVLNSWEWITERAAILQFDADMDRETAEAQAFLCWYNQFVEANPHE